MLSDEAVSLTIFVFISGETGSRACSYVFAAVICGYQEGDMKGFGNRVPALISGPRENDNKWKRKIQNICSSGSGC